MRVICPSCPSFYKTYFVGESMTSASDQAQLLFWYYAGNGKGVLKETLQAAIGDYHGAMSKDAVVTAPGQKAPSKNAPTNYIYDMMGLRIAVTDETAENERVDLWLLLAMTGGGDAKGRCLYGNPVDFTITHTPFVQTNYPPVIPATAVKDNVERRVRVIPFPNTYVGTNTFDPTNATHRLRDDGLKARMKEKESLRQVLSWIARGSVEWYSSADGLGPPPQAMKDATHEYLSDADKLQLFLDQHCKVGEGLSTLQINFATLYREFSSERVSNEDLARRMEKKGFKRLKNNESPRQLYYPKIKCEYVI
jgi:putative DNA primase/helicase